MSVEPSTVKESLTNYLPACVDENTPAEESWNNEEETEILSSTDSDFLFEEYSKTFEIVKELAGTWFTHRFDDIPWADDYRSYVQLEEEITEEEIENIGVLTDNVIGSNLSYLERSPEDLHHVLCKCVLASKQLCDISEIRFYHYIQYLDLSCNELTTLTPLEQLPFLQYLDVSNNSLQYLLDFKAPFYLTFVNFSYNLVSFIPDLTQFWSVTHLNLSHNEIVEITGIQKLRFLSYLDLSFNKIEKLQNLDYLRLQFLILHHNIIKNSEDDYTTKFKTLSHIRSIDVSYNQLTSLKPFENTGNLESIDVSNNNISSLLEVYYLQNLRYLSRVNFYDNPISTMKFYIDVCLSTIKHLMILDEKEITAEQRISVKKSCEVDPSFPARESHIDLVLLQQINQPYVGPYIVPYDQPPPIVVILVGPPGSMKKDVLKAFLKTNINLEYGVSHTTRPKLNNEIHGKDYYFVTTEDFKTLTRKGRFIAVSEFNGQSYGIVHEELRKSMNKILIFHSDINSALSLRIMGINPILVLAMPRDEHTHSRWLKLKYYYDYVQRGIIRVKNCPDCGKTAESFELSSEGININVINILEHIIEMVVLSDENLDIQEKYSLQEMETTVRFNIPCDERQYELCENDQDRLNTMVTACSILKRKMTDSTDELIQTPNETANDTLMEDPHSKEHQKRVSFNGLPDMNSDHEYYKYRSISEAIVGRGQQQSRSLLSSLSAAVMRTESILTEISEESSEFYDIQDEMINEFINNIIDSRNKLLEVHWSNPGLFREIIFTDNVEESLKKLKSLVKFIIENYKFLEPTISFDKDIAFKNIVNSRLSKLDLQGMSNLKTINQGQCKC